LSSIIGTGRPRLEGEAELGVEEAGRMGEFTQRARTAIQARTVFGTTLPPRMT
jgi:hypothetical protein